MRTAEPAWLVAKIDQRIAQVMEHATKKYLKLFDTIFVQLTDPPSDPAAYARWDHECDRCGKHDPAGFRSGHVERKLEDGTHFIIGFGVCSDCGPDDN